MHHADAVKICEMYYKRDGRVFIAALFFPLFLCVHKEIVTMAWGQANFRRYQRPQNLFHVFINEAS